MGTERTTSPRCNAFEGCRGDPRGKAEHLIIMSTEGRPPPLPAEEQRAEEIWYPIWPLEDLTTPMKSWRLWLRRRTLGWMLGLKYVVVCFRVFINWAINGEKD